MTVRVNFMIKTILETNRLYLKILDETYCNQVADFLVNNKEFFAPFETIKAPFFYSPMYQKNILDREFKASLNKEYLRYYVFLKTEPNKIIGTVSFGNIMSFPYCSATIGYRFDKAHTGCGYAAESLASAIPYAFSALKLHRICAYILPDNLPSIKLAERLGFTREGLCESNLNVNGVWKSHYQYSLVNHH